MDFRSPVCPEKKFFSSFRPTILAIVFISVFTQFSAVNLRFSNLEKTKHQLTFQLFASELTFGAKFFGKGDTSIKKKFKSDFVPDLGPKTDFFSMVVKMSNSLVRSIVLQSVFVFVQMYGMGMYH